MISRAKLLGVILTVVAFSVGTGHGFVLRFLDKAPPWKALVDIESIPLLFLAAVCLLPFFDHLEKKFVQVLIVSATITSGMVLCGMGIPVLLVYALHEQPW